MKKNTITRIPKYLQLIILLSFILFTSVPISADTADSLITTEITWSSDVNLTSSVVIKDGGKLTIEAGVTVGFNYVDLNLDDIGDLNITIENGGALVIKGTPQNPVIFEPIGSAPPAGNERRHWSGIIFESADSSSNIDTLRYFEIWNARDGLVINRELTAAGISVYNADSTAIVVNQFDSTSSVTLCGLTIQDLGGGGVTGTAVSIFQPNTSVSYAVIDTIAGTGIYCYTDDISLDWISLTYAETGILNEENAGSTLLQNSTIQYCSKSGLFNHEGNITVYNSTFANNAFNGIVNSSGILNASYSQINDNTLRGVLIGGDAETLIENITNTANGSYGCEIVKNNIPYDTDVLTGPYEYNMAGITFTFSNIYENNGGVDEVQVYNQNDTTTVMNFTRNWWGKASGINFLIQMDEPGTVDYSNWKLDGLYADATSDLSPTESVAFTYPIDGQSVIENTDVTVTWETTGNFASLIFESTDPVIADTIPNCGSYTFTAGSGTTDLTLSEYTDGTPTTQITVTSTTLLQLTKPVGGDILYGRQSDTISWVAPSSVQNIKLEYSTNAGSSWDIIAEDITATANAFIWSTENAAADYSNGLIRISDSDNSAVFDTNFVRIIPTPPSTEGSDSSWMFTETNTALSIGIGDLKLYKNVYAPDTATAGNELISGTEDLYVGAFYRSGDDYICCGFSYVQNFDGAHAHIDTVTIFAYGDDPLTGEKDGFVPGDTVFFRLWRLPWDADSTMTPVNETDSSAAYFTFTAAGSVSIDHLRFWSGVDSEPLYLKDSVVIPMESNWKLISSYVIPDTADLSWANNAVTGSGILSKPTSYGQGLKVDPDNFIILKDGKEGIYWLVNYNAGGPDSILVDRLENSWDYKKGYSLKMNAPDTLVIIGNRIKPQEEILSFEKGWNIIPYYRNSTMNITQALSTIADLIDIVKDSNGKVYWPLYTIDEIGTLQPGSGYYVRFNSDVSFRYPINAPPVVQKKDSNPEPSKYKTGFNSDNSMVLCITDEAWNGKIKKGSEIAAFDRQGNITGSALYNGGNTALVIWGKESIGLDDRGMEPEEPYSLKIWDGSEEHVLTGLSFIEGNGYYQHNGVAVINRIENIGNNLPVTFSLSQNYPNPFNPETVIEFALPITSDVTLTIYNVLGERVKDLFSGNLSAGYHQIAFNAEDLPTGVYLYRIKAGDFTSVKKMMLLK